jgi:PAS domain S-box-containing protein
MDAQQKETAPLATEHRLLRTLIDNLPDGIYVKDTKGRKTMANPADLKVLGRHTEAEVLGKSDFDLFPKEVAEKFWADDQKVLKGEPVINREEFFLDEQGRKCWLLTTKLPLRDPDGKIVGLIGIGRNITGQKQAEEALRQSRDELEKRVAGRTAELAKERRLLVTLIDNLPDIIFAKDAQSRFTLTNTACARQLGAGQMEEVLGKMDSHFVSPELASQYLADEQALMQAGQPVTKEEPFQHKGTGKMRWSLTTKVPLKDEAGNVVGLMGIARDITERKQAGETLARERNLLRTLIDNLPDGIYAKDTEARKILANPANCRRVGCQTEAEVIGKTDFDIFPKEIAAGFFADDQSVLKTGQPIINREEKIALPNGETRWTLTTKVPWRDAAGKIIGLVGIGRDITERKNLEEQMVSARRMESLGRLATGVAHDLNNILAPILISIELLQKKLQDEEYLKMLAKAEANAHRGADIIKQMLWFGRGMAGQRLPVDLQKLAGGVAQFASETFNKAIRVETQWAPDLGTVIGDAAQLHQVLMNLCLNARDAMPSGGTLTIAARNAVVDANRFVVLEVKDTGCGIAPGLLDKIFEPFFTTKDVGHGLGLSTAQSIVKSHGGFINIESQPGHGSTFSVHLPAQA